MTLAAGELVAATGLGMLTIAIANAPPTGFDSAVRRRALRLTTPPSRRLIHLLTAPGHPSVYFPITALLIYALRRGGHLGSEALAIAAMGGWATHRGIKLFVRRRRPRTMHGRSTEYTAFPSGHTTASTAIAVTAAIVLHRRGLLSGASAVALATIPPVAIGAGRVLADQHWATDVIGGWIAGLAVAAIAATESA